MASLLKGSKDFYFRKRSFELPEIFRWNNILRNDEYLPYTLFNKKFKNSKTGRSKIKSRSILTGRARAVINKFKMDRITMKQLAVKGYISGLKKSGW